MSATSANPFNRCYFCKTHVFGDLAAAAWREGYEVLLDGTNADGAGDFRPGMQAAAERGARSPLREAGITKAEIAAARRAGPDQLGSCHLRPPRASLTARRSRRRRWRSRQGRMGLASAASARSACAIMGTWRASRCPWRSSTGCWRSARRSSLELLATGYTYVALDLVGLRSNWPERRDGAWTRRSCGRCWLRWPQAASRLPRPWSSRGTCLTRTWASHETDLLRAAAGAAGGGLLPGQGEHAVAIFERLWANHDRVMGACHARSSPRWSAARLPEARRILLAER